jgi:hypothetical protein
LSVDINIFDKDKCIGLFFSLAYFWDSMVVAIGNNATNLRFNDVVSLEMRQKNMEGQSTYALFVRGCSQERNKNKSSSGRSKSIGRSKSPGKFVKVCWRCGKEWHYKKHYRSKSVERGKGFDDDPYKESKTSTDEGGDEYLDSSITHADHEAWLVDSSASFHMNSHKEWFCEYEKYDGGDVFLGDDLKTKIVG